MMTNGQRQHWKKFCSDSLDKIEHYEEALAENFKGWCIHHRLEIQPDGTRVSMQELKSKGLYYGRPAEELVFMKVGEHHSLHHKDKVISTDTRRKMSEALSGENHPFFGKHRAEETRQKISYALKGKTFSKEHCKKLSTNNAYFWKGKHRAEETRKKLSEAICGMLWWNNGILSTRSRECPGEGWKRGRLKASSSSLRNETAFQTGLLS